MTGTANAGREITRNDGSQEIFDSVCEAVTCGDIEPLIYSARITADESLDTPLGPCHGKRVAFGTEHGRITECCRPFRALS